MPISAPLSQCCTGLHGGMVCRGAMAATLKSGERERVGEAEAEAEAAEDAHTACLVTGGGRRVGEVKLYSSTTRAVSL